MAAAGHIGWEGGKVFLDADAYVKNFSVTIEEVADEFLSGSESILVTQDCQSLEFCWSEAPNTGVLLLKNAPSAFAFLDEWALAPRDGGLCDASLHIDHREQGCFGKIVSEVPALGRAVKVLSRQEGYLLNSENGTFVVHHVGHYGEDRRARMIGDLKRVISSFE